MMLTLLMPFTPIEPKGIKKNQLVMLQILCLKHNVALNLFGCLGHLVKFKSIHTECGYVKNDFITLQFVEVSRNDATVTQFLKCITYFALITSS